MTRIFTTLMALAMFSLPALAQKPYFQQDVAYTIRVTLDDQQHFLRATEELIYKNNSPDTLHEIYMHLWPNAYLRKNTAYAQQEIRNGSTTFHFAKDSTLGYIDSLDFRIDGEPAAWKADAANPDIAKIELSKPLAPGASLRLTTPFRVKLPASYSRMGHVRQQYQITQWYPKPAVYDRDGWQAMPYLDQGEFYSEFGTFDVYITIGKNYVVGSTGDLPDGDPELSWLAAREKKSRELMADSTVEEADIFPEEFAAGVTKTLHFHQEKVHDFAWFADKKYYVMSGEIELPETHNKVRCVTMFNHRGREYWRNATQYVADAVYSYSAWNGDYPYKHATAVDGALSAGAGMEYPNITVVAAGGSSKNLEEVIMHEVGHNWYYGILGSNERLHPWMDEGLNTYFENRYMLIHYGDSSGLVPAGIGRMLGLPNDHTGTLRLAYSFSAMAGEDQPIELPAIDYTGTNYGTIVYMKTGLAFRYLEAYLGREMDDKCFHAYFARWKFRHPTPADLQAVFEETSGKDLDWFFNGFLSTVDQLDFRISNIDGNVIELKNQSRIKAPAGVTLYDKAGKEIRTIWTEPFEDKTTITLNPPVDFYRAVVNADKSAPELDGADNQLKAKGLFPRCRPLDIQFGYKYPDPSKAWLYWLPAVGYNTSDGPMAGLLLYSGFLPRDNASFHLMPMYGFGSGQLSGSAGFTLRKVLTGNFRELSVRHRTSHYAGLLRSRDQIVLSLRSKKPATGFHKSLELNFYHNKQDYSYAHPLGYILRPQYGELAWNMVKGNALSTWKIRVAAGTNYEYITGRASAEAKWTYKFSRKMNLGLRGFAAGVIGDGFYVPFALQYRPSGSYDPFGDKVVIDRNHTSSWLGRQLIPDQGGFRAIHYQSFDRVFAGLNADVKLPFPFIYLFGDAGFGSDSYFGSSGLIYDAGFALRIIPDVLDIRFPVAGSMYTNGIPAGGQEFSQQINFVFDPTAFLHSRSLSILGFN